MKPLKAHIDQPSAFQLFQSRLDQQLNPTPSRTTRRPYPLATLRRSLRTTLLREQRRTHLMVGLEYLKDTYNLSDEELAARWLENPYRQYFCGEVYFQTTLSFHCTSLGKWRKRIGTEKLKLILAETICIVKVQNYVHEQDLTRVVVDTTVQEKKNTFPTDAKLLARGDLDRGNWILNVSSL